MKVLVTGSTGFVAPAVIRALADSGWDVRGVSRANGPSLEDPQADWSALLRDVDAVVHLAGLAHVTQNRTELAARYRAVNAVGTVRLATQAAEKGVRRFVFMSSVKVHGDVGRFTETSPRVADDPYGLSKRIAEDDLGELSATTGLAVTILRPPLVYGPGVKANLAALERAIRRGLPLPLGAVTNARSFVGVDNLSSAVVRSLASERAGAEAFLVSDGHDLSTPDLIRAIGDVLGRPTRLFAVPIPLLRFGAALAGRRDDFDRLAGSLTVDISKAARELGWRPPHTVAAQLQKAFRA